MYQSKLAIYVQRSLHNGSTNYIARVRCCISGSEFISILSISSRIHWHRGNHKIHYNDVIMSVMASQITSASIIYSTVCSRADQRKHQSSASLAFVRGIHRWPVNSPHKGPVRIIDPQGLPENCIKLSWLYSWMKQKCLRRWSEKGFLYIDSYHSVKHIWNWMRTILLPVASATVLNHMSTCVLKPIGLNNERQVAEKTEHRDHCKQKWTLLQNIQIGRSTPDNYNCISTVYWNRKFVCVRLKFSALQTTMSNQMPEWPFRLYAITDPSPPRNWHHMRPWKIYLFDQWKQNNNRRENVILRTLQAFSRAHLTSRFF